MKTNQKSTEPDKRTAGKSKESKQPKETKRPKETLEERVHRHINDINSKITDDDIRNVRTELEIRSEGPATPRTDNVENKQSKRSSKKKENEKDSSARHSTLWDMLSEGYD